MNLEEQNFQDELCHICKKLYNCYCNNIDFEELLEAEYDGCVDPDDFIDENETLYLQDIKP